MLLALVSGRSLGDDGSHDIGGRVICPRFQIGGRLIRTIIVAAWFESVADVTLDELRVELFYREDAAVGALVPRTCRRLLIPRLSPRASPASCRPGGPPAGDGL